MNQSKTANVFVAFSDEEQRETAREIKENLKTTNVSTPNRTRWRQRQITASRGRDLSGKLAMVEADPAEAQFTERGF